MKELVGNLDWKTRKTERSLFILRETGSKKVIKISSNNLI